MSVAALHSLPSATVKLYLAFEGAGPDTFDGLSVPTTPACLYTDAQKAEVWARIAEDYAPLKIDVTTEDPGTYPHQVVMRSVIGGNGAWYTPGGALGVTDISGFILPFASNTSWVFSELIGSVKGLAWVVGHEAGHGFGLKHQSSYSGTTKTAEYNTGDANVAPIMGNSSGAIRGTWWNGPNTDSSTTIQDDLAVLSAGGNGFGYRTSPWATTSAGASSQTALTSGGSVSSVIITTAHVEVHKLTHTGGTLTLTCTPGSYMASLGLSNGGTLNPKLRLLDSSGTQLDSTDSATVLTKSIAHAALSAGTYYAEVSSHGSYGDVGTYTLTTTSSDGGTPNVLIQHLRPIVATQAVGSTHPAFG
jgi:hypothetical protein